MLFLTPNNLSLKHIILNTKIVDFFPCFFFFFSKGMLTLIHQHIDSSVSDSCEQ